MHIIIPKKSQQEMDLHQQSGLLLMQSPYKALAARIT